mgnify:CR=1 FL=1
MTALIEKTRVPLQIDVGFGDRVVPEPEQIDFPTLLNFPAPHLRSYTRESMVAEKFEAMVKLGMLNTRMKDFFDVWTVSQEFSFDGPTLSRAIGRLIDLPRAATLLATTVTTPIWGKLADLFSQKVLVQSALVIFSAGSLVAESGESVLIEQFVHPVRDMFVAIFFVLASLAPRHAEILSLSGFLAFLLTFALARHFGPTERAGIEMLPVILLSSFIIGLPPAFSPPLRGTTMPAMLVGVVAAQAVWAIHRYPPLPKEPSPGVWRNALRGAGVGLLGGLGLVCIAAAVLALKAIGSAPTPPRAALALLMPGYLLGGTIGGGIAGALRPLWRWPLGTMLAGALGGFALYASIGPAANYPEQPPLSEHLAIAAACGLLVGPAVAISWRYSDPFAA